MTFFKNDHKNISYHPFLEFLIVTISLITILVPLRIASRIIFADEWVGSLGMISIVFGAILFLSKKEKLGKFGQIFLRQIIKNYKGKKKVIIYFQTGLFLSIGIFTIFSINAGNTDNQILKDQILEEFLNQGIIIDSEWNYDSIEKISSQVSTNEQIESIISLPLLIIENFEIFSVVLAVTDQLMGGWVMYFWQVMVIEVIEITLVVVISKKILLKNS